MLELTVRKFVDAVALTLVVVIIGMATFTHNQSHGSPLKKIEGEVDSITYQGSNHLSMSHPPLLQCMFFLRIH